jgi:uncharacterized protein YndB with AHSA1/START domain
MSTPNRNELGVQSVTVRRVIAASPDELFDAWLDPASVAEWMRPSGIARTTATIDARVGGRYEISMLHGSEPLLHEGEYREIDRPRRLVFTWISAATRQTSSLVTVSFVPRGKKTEVVVLHERLPGAEAVPSHTAGWTEAIERLANVLEAAEAGERA